MRISQIAAHLKRMSGEMQEFATTHNDMDLPNEIVLPLIMNFLTGNLIEISPVNSVSPNPTRESTSTRAHHIRDTLARVATGGFTFIQNWRDQARLRRSKRHSND
jgi:hypothetical protein